MNKILKFEIDKYIKVKMKKGDDGKVEIINVEENNFIIHIEHIDDVYNFCNLRRTLNYLKNKFNLYCVNYILSNKEYYCHEDIFKINRRKYIEDKLRCRDLKRKLLIIDIENKWRKKI